MKFGTWVNMNAEFNSDVYFFILRRTKIPFFRQIWSKISKLLISEKIWYIDQFRIHDDVHFFCFGPEISFLEKLVPNFTKLLYDFA